MTRNCPPSELLSALSLGIVPSVEVESLSTHIETCDDCGQRLLEMNLLDDSFVRNLRRHLSGCTRPIGRSVAVNASNESFPRSFGPYELLSKIGQGGMGVVYMARHRQLNRIVALKVARFGSCDDEIAISRFRVEAEAISRLKHENIVQLYEFGEAEGQHYFSMEYVHGANLSKRIGGRPMEPRKIAAVVTTLARAVQVAHDNSVIHRDLKPANVLIDESDVVKLTDFGLAKLLDAETDQTRTELIMGTAAYMAPEQATCSMTKSPSIDVYGLGAILYEGLSGQPPFSGAGNIVTLEMVRTLAPLPPTHRNPNIPRPLEAICLKCLEKKPRDRYASAAALADDLARWLGGNSPKVWKRRWLIRPIIYLRKHATLAAIYSVIVFAVAGTVLINITNRDRTESPPNFDPQVIDSIESALARGEPVDLIAAKGTPRWWRIRTEPSQGQLAADEDGRTLIRSWGTSLFELVRDSQKVPFCFSAEIKHVRSDARGRVGIYVAYRRTETPNGPIHQFFRLDISDILEFPNSPPDKQSIAQEDTATKIPISIIPCYFAEDRQDNVWGIQLGGASQRYGTRKASGQTEWHRLELHVREREIEGFWDGKAIGPLKFEDVAADAAESFSRPRAKNDDKFFAYACPDFDLRGGIGFYTSRSVALIRFASITPLPGRKQQ